MTRPATRGDAVLVVPEPNGPPAAYGRLVAFVRGAPDAPWQAVAAAMADRLGPSPVWLGAGMGMP